MPIRINLLSEQLLAEEQRRRNPVKVAIWAGGFLVALMLLWGLSCFFKVRHAKAELDKYKADLESLAAKQNETKSNYFASVLIEQTMASLQKYASNRFLWGTALDALQQAMVADVRIEKFASSQAYFTVGPTKFTTNLACSLKSRPKWQFWKSQTPITNIQTIIATNLYRLTNHERFLTNTFERLIKVQVSTNKEKTLASAKIDIATPLVAVERTTNIVAGRDYGNPRGQQFNAFYAGIGKLPYFRQALKTDRYNTNAIEGHGLIANPVSQQPTQDNTDPIEATRRASFVTFSIGLHFKDKLLSND
jgi:hypothetical protein